MTASLTLPPSYEVNGAPDPQRRPRNSLPGAEALADLMAFASRAADASPDVARVALLGWAAAAAPGFPIAVVLRDAGVDLEQQRAVRRLAQAASIPTLE